MTILTSYSTNHHAKLQNTDCVNQVTGLAFTGLRWCIILLSLTQAAEQGVKGTELHGLLPRPHASQHDIAQRQLCGMQTKGGVWQGSRGDKRLLARLGLSQAGEQDEKDAEARAASAKNRWRQRPPDAGLSTDMHVTWPVWQQMLLVTSLSKACKYAARTFRCRSTG